MNDQWGYSVFVSTRNRRGYKSIMKKKTPMREYEIKICQQYQLNRKCLFNFICHNTTQSFDNKYRRQA